MATTDWAEGAFKIGGNPMFPGQKCFTRTDGAQVIQETPHGGRYDEGGRKQGIWYARVNGRSLKQRAESYSRRYENGGGRRRYWYTPKAAMKAVDKEFPMEKKESES